MTISWQNEKRYLSIVEQNIIYIRVITKLPNSEQSNKGKVKTHKYRGKMKKDMDKHNL
jgi:hypothetical protein